MKKILVTGGAGFIGSHTVVELHNAGYYPVLLDNFCNSKKSVMDGLKAVLCGGIKLYEGNCVDRHFVEKVFSCEKIDGVIHFAAIKAVGESIEKPVEYYHNNIGSTLVILDVMKKFNVRPLVFSSSACVYGQPEILPATENTPVTRALSPYGNTKQICEEVISDTVKSQANIKAVSLRYFNPIGAHPSARIGEFPIGVPNNLIPFVTQTAAGIHEKLTVFGDDYNTPDGTCIRDYLHVTDLAKAHVKALEYLESINENNFYDVFNLGTGRGNSVMEVIKTFEEVNNIKVNYVIGPRRSGDVESLYANCEKAKKILGWQTNLTLKDALRDAWNWQLSLR